MFGSEASEPKFRLTGTGFPMCVRGPVAPVESTVAKPLMRREDTLPLSWSPESNTTQEVIHVS